MTKQPASVRFDFMYVRMLASLPVTGVEWLRPEFTRWWEQLCEWIDKEEDK